MKTNIQIFSNDVFGEIRTCQVDNQIMFVGRDVAKALGYSNTSDALRKHVDDEDKGVAKCDTLGGTQKTTLINESGLYALILTLMRQKIAAAFPEADPNDIEVELALKLMDNGQLTMDNEQLTMDN